MAKHEARPQTPPFEIPAFENTAADRDHAPKHSKDTPRPPRLRVVIDVKNSRKAS
ncbi:hypothetical protein [Kibdelosporangium phytohabitans]|uniref:hypothetical protein n=1 Tax=Kibdelosporangium phytohabitans TaxID=860235 RepID=UPI0012FB2B0D|nr:hypothetical protein [Kibdelosporangium phytohabitans]MBE1467690.1 hypothetical protein [Kibdelosporangium phytohabitans]